MFSTMIRRLDSPTLFERSRRKPRQSPRRAIARRHANRPRYPEPLEPRCLLANVALVSETTPSRGIVATEPIYDAVGIDWTGIDPAFDDSEWTPSTSGGPNGIGAPISPGGKYAGFASINAAAMVGATNTSFLRIPFALPSAGTIAGLTLKMRFDDAFIAYLNGVEVARQNIASPGYPAWDVPASSFGSDATAVFTSFDISAHRTALRSGTNILAVRGFDRPQVGSFPVTQDFVVQATLDAEIVNVPPTANDDAATTATDTPAVINVLANDLPGDDPIDPTTVEVVQPPAFGTHAIDPSTGAIAYTPDDEFRGADTFTYRVRDTADIPTPDGPMTTLVVVSTTAAHRRLVPTAAQAATWTGSGTFDDSTWLVGAGGVGYDTDVAVDYEPYIQNGLVTMQNVNGSVYARYPFTLIDPTKVVGLRLQMRYEDGFVAWINGVEVARAGAPTPALWNSLANGGARNEAAAIAQTEFVVDLAAAGLVLKDGAGANILAIQGLNDTLGSSDLLIQPELLADLGPTGRWSNEATVTITVQGEGPTAFDDDAQTTGVAPVTIAVLANDEIGVPPNDFPLRPESVQFAQHPANGTATIDPVTGEITYRANPGFFGEDSFQYTVRDAAPVGGDVTTLALLPRRSTWKYLDNGTNQGTAWRSVDFDDTAWASGPAKLGYGTNQTTTVGYGPNASNKYITTYFRTTFDLDDSSAVQDLSIAADYDDGIVVYLNGLEVARESLPAGPITYQTLATTHNGGSFQTIGLLTSELSSLFRPGTNVVAVEIHQSSLSSSDISMDVEMVATIRGPSGRRSNVATVTVAVASTNEPPQAINDAALTKVDQPLPIDVLANDVPDGAPIDPATVTVVAGPTQGSVTIAANGQVTYTPAASFAGEDTFTYTVRDTAGRESNVAIVSIDVVPSIPLPVDDDYYVDEDDVLNVPAAFGVLSNDTDDGGILVSAALIEPPLHGAMTLDADGGFRYVPAPDFYGDDQFRYRATDNHGESAGATATVRVAPSPDAPVAFDDAFTTTAGTPLDVLAAPLERRMLIPAEAQWRYLDDGSNQGSGWRSSNFDDSAWASGNAQFGYGDGDETTVVRFGDDFNNRYITTYFRRDLFLTSTVGIQAVRLGLLRDDGAAVYLNEQRVVLSNLPTSIGYETFAQRSVAGDEENAFQEFQLAPETLQPGRNVVAVEVHQSSQVSSDMSFDLFLEVELAGPRDGGVLLNDLDVDGDVLSATLIASPMNGTLALLPDGGFTYTPNPGFVGIDTFRYRAIDGLSQSNVATVTIDVREPTGSNSDLNADGQVDRRDLALLVASFGKAADALASEGDLDGNGAVGLHDAITLRNALSPPPAPAAAVVVAKANDRAIVQTTGVPGAALKANHRSHRPIRAESRARFDATDRAFAATVDAVTPFAALPSRLSARARR